MAAVGVGGGAPVTRGNVSTPIRPETEVGVMAKMKSHQPMLESGTSSRSGKRMSPVIVMRAST